MSVLRTGPIFTESGSKSGTVDLVLKKTELKWEKPDLDPGDTKRPDPTESRSSSTLF